jgi:hypothetical protein
MNRIQEGDHKTDTMKVFGIILPSLPLILLRSAGALLRFKRSAKKAGSTFQKELLHQGIDESTASELTKMYLETSNIKNYIGLFR